MNDIAIVAAALYRRLPLLDRVALALDITAADPRTGLTKSELTSAFFDVAKKKEKDTGKDLEIPKDFEFGPLVYGIVESYVKSGSIRRGEVADVISYIFWGLTEHKGPRSEWKTWDKHWLEAKEKGKSFPAFMKNRLKTTIYNYMAERKRKTREKPEAGMRKEDDEDEGGGFSIEEHPQRAVDVEGEQVAKEIVHKIDQLIGGDTEQQKKLNKMIWEMQLHEDMRGLLTERGGATELAEELTKKLGKPISPQLAYHYLKGFRREFKKALEHLDIPGYGPQVKKYFKNTSQLTPLVSYLYYLSDFV